MGAERICPCFLNKIVLRYKLCFTVVNPLPPSDAHKIDCKTDHKTNFESLDRRLCSLKLVKILKLLEPLKLKKSRLHMASDKTSLKYKNEVF